MKIALCRIEATNFTVIVENEEQVEVSFTRLWNSSLEGQVVPLNIDKRSSFAHITSIYLSESILFSFNKIMLMRKHFPGS